MGDIGKNPRRIEVHPETAPVLPVPDPHPESVPEREPVPARTSRSILRNRVIMGAAIALSAVPMISPLAHASPESYIGDLRSYGIRIFNEQGTIGDGYKVCDQIAHGASRQEMIDTLIAKNHGSLSAPYADIEIDSAVHNLCIPPPPAPMPVQTPQQMLHDDCVKFENDLHDKRAGLGLDLVAIAADLPADLAAPAALAICGIQAGVNDIPDDIDALLSGVIGTAAKAAGG